MENQLFRAGQPKGSRDRSNCAKHEGFQGLACTVANTKGAFATWAISHRTASIIAQELGRLKMESVVQYE